MTTGYTLRAAVMGLGFAAMLGSTAFAAPVKVDDAPGGDGIFASANLHHVIKVKFNGAKQDADAGAFGLVQSNAAPGFPPGSFSQLITYCFEFGESIGGLPTTYQSQALSSVLSSAVTDAISRLWAKSFADSVSETSTNFEGVSGINAKERAAAFQAAVWELAVDGVGGSLGGGNFEVETGSGAQGDIRRMAQKYLDIAKDTSNTTLASLEALTFKGKQDLLRPGPGGPGGATVPAPGTLALFGAGMVALAAFRRLKKA